MSELGTEIRSYYEQVVERVDPEVPRAVPTARRTDTMRAGIGLAVLIGLIVLLVFGLAPLLIQSDSDPIAPPTTVTATTVANTTSPRQAVGPSRIVLADGTEIGGMGSDGQEPPRDYTLLFGYVMRELTSNSEYWPAGADPAQILGLYPDSPQMGVTVELSVDPLVQEVVESVIFDWKSDPETFITVVVVDNETGRLVAAGPGFRTLGGGIFDPERRLPAGSLAQVYATVAALEAGYGLESEWEASSPQTFTSPSSDRTWTVRNPGENPETHVTLEQGLYRSVNTVFAGVGVELGANPILDAAARLGVELRGLEVLRPLDDPFGGIVPLEAVATGAGTISTFDAAAMFATLSRRGVSTPPVFVERISGADGEIIYQAPQSADVTVDGAVVEDVNRALAKVTSIGTAPRASIGVPQIGKTGTADNYLAAWYAGSTDRYTIAISVGKLSAPHDLVPLENVEFNDQFYRRVFGGSVPAPIWAEIMTELLELP